MAEEGDRRDRKSEGGKDKEMKKPILTLGMVLALAAALFVPAAVMASDTTLVTGEIKSASITATAPDSIDLDVLVWSADGNLNTAFNGGSVHVDPGSWNLDDLAFRMAAVADQSGYMKDGDKQLANMLQVQFDDEGWGTADVPKEKLWTEASEGVNTFAFHVKQVIHTVEEVGEYSITITFTAQIDTGE